MPVRMMMEVDDTQERGGVGARRKSHVRQNGDRLTPFPEVPSISEIFVPISPHHNVGDGGNITFFGPLRRRGTRCSYNRSRLFLCTSTGPSICRDDFPSRDISYLISQSHVRRHQTPMAGNGIHIVVRISCAHPTSEQSHLLQTTSDVP